MLFHHNERTSPYSIIVMEFVVAFGARDVVLGAFVSLVLNW